MIEEKLKLMPLWLLAFLFLDLLIVLILVFAVSWKDDPQGTLSTMLIIGGVFGLIFIFLHFIHLKVKMEYRQFSFRIVPFSFKPRMISPDEIIYWKIRPLKVMREFHGFGKRKKGKTTAYVVDSKFAIEFELLNGDHIVVSIHNDDEWRRTLNRSSVWEEKMKVD